MVKFRYMSQGIRIHADALPLMIDREKVRRAEKTEEFFMQA